MRSASPRGPRTSRAATGARSPTSSGARCRSSASRADSPAARTVLVSRSRSGTGGNGPSSQPSASGNHYDSSSGSRIAYQTLATNVGGPFRDTNGVSDIVRSVVEGSQVSSRYASNGQSCRTLGNGPSQRPAISEAGTTVLSATDASNFTCYSSERDRNGSIADVFVWTERRLGSILWSFDTNKRELELDSRNPATSARTNYNVRRRPGTSAITRCTCGTAGRSPEPVGTGCTRGNAP